jgi:sulfatase maturation enzyme AslB (radical SAM superfamily)
MMTDAVTATMDLHAFTPGGAPRGYIQPYALRELWFHTGTACNLACPFCLEGSKPGDGRLERIKLADVKALMDEAAGLGVEQFSFTGGEPFVVKGIVEILEYASSLRPCLVLTNGTDALLKRLRRVADLKSQPNPIAFRVSIDYPDPGRHDAGRGAGSFDLAWQALKALHALGFKISLARQKDEREAPGAVEGQFRDLLTAHGLPEDTKIVGFPDFGTPSTRTDVPDVTERCMTAYQTEESRRQFMCAFSKMVVKKNGRVRVYACTLVDDDESYDLGSTLAESMGKRILMHHHRCYRCFAYKSSCSELGR